MPTSTGRGGAGNMSSKAAVAAPTSHDLTTPTIKNDVYTTGRGGSGNMAQNLSSMPEYARAAQDVAPPPMKLGGAADDAGAVTYTGRGGGGNVLRGGERQGSFRSGSREREAAREKLRAAAGSGSDSGAEAEMSGANGGGQLARVRSSEQRGAGSGGERRASGTLVGKGKELIEKIRGESKRRDGERRISDEKKRSAVV